MNMIFLLRSLDLKSYYSAFQVDEPHIHNQNQVGTFHGTSLLWSTEMKTAVNKNVGLC
ncbi:hypothetical protein [Dapis sp. BLCC M172]|uniref:hypothetical protein n=1 Tax=Dapis sp. BLCC M172 TaxID=2975281 RepID=UPI003CF370E3